MPLLHGYDNASYYRARYYDPSIGRLISEDPIGFSGDGVNFYAYVLNSPVNFTDPFGLTCTYSQRTGVMVCVDDNTGQIYYTGQGYAGTGNGRNNPNAQNQDFVGPLPQGEYQLTGNWYHNNHTGANTMNLQPLDPRNNPCQGTTRDCNSFRIHGDNRAHDASQGCIVLPPDRTRIHIGETLLVTQ